MKKVLFFLLCMTSTLYADMAISSFSSIKAKDMLYNGKEITLIGDVYCKHKMGLIRCDKAYLILPEEKKEKSSGKILLLGNVKVELEDGAVLESDEANMDCETFEGEFDSKAPNKVTYTSFMQDGNKKVPLKTTSYSMKVKMKKEKGASDYAFTEVQGQGAVSIECLRENATQEIAVNEESNK